mmetsp:Transcript_7347/g.18561  ORF Transcript_7347/g.18561 Transcript_7347/m.18561 type:complete len:419 (-) Transcript_7347:41-1297(-)
MTENPPKLSKGKKIFKSITWGRNAGRKNLEAKINKETKAPADDSAVPMPTTPTSSEQQAKTPALYRIVAAFTDKKKKSSLSTPRSTTCSTPDISVAAPAAEPTTPHTPKTPKLAESDTALVVQPHGTWSSVSGLQCEKGHRPTMEDTHAMFDNAQDEFPDKQLPAMAYYGVYDGHSGLNTSALCEQHLHRFILDEFKDGVTPMEALKAGLTKADDFICKQAIEEGWKNGATVVVVVLVEGVLYAVNVGDAEAVVGVRKLPADPEGPPAYTCLRLSTAHRAKEASEKARILGQGGMVIGGRVFGDLAISRALGDPDYKIPKSASNFVSNDPHCQEHALRVGVDEFMVLACDGLWDTIAYQRVVDLVGGWRAGGSTAQEASELLVKEAMSKNCRDNITCMVVYFQFQEEEQKSGRKHRKK